MPTNWNRARALLPTADYDSEAWRSHWSSNGDVFTRMLGDVYRVYKSEQAKRNGTANPSGGRRSRVIDGNVEELFSIVTPQLSVDFLPVSLREAMGTTSQRKLARACGIPQSTISRWLSQARGTPPPDRYDLERLARALDVHPAFFVEWRIEVLTSLMREVLTAQPTLSMTLLKAVS